ncbi:MAG: hypothetical protein AAB903_00930, partial [Patescibacteria group bacterium]
GLAQENETKRNIVASYGNPGIFVIDLISGFNLAVPVPAIAFLPLFLESGLSFWIGILTITLGVTMADMVAYFIGKLSFEITSQTAESRVVKKLEAIRKKYQWGPPIILFVFAAVVPLPNELLVIPMGFLGYRFIHILPPIIAGNLVFNLLYSTGVITIFEFL